MELEHEGAGVLFGQRDVDPLLKSEEYYWCPVSKGE